MPPLKQCVNQFLGGKQLDAARSLDAAQLRARNGADLPANVRWAESLYLLPKWPLADAKAEQLPLALEKLYDAGLPLPAARDWS